MTMLDRATCSLISILTVCSTTNCGREVPAERAADPAPSTPPPAKVPAVPEPPAAPAQQPVAVEPPIEAAAGEWLDSGMYQFRLTGIRRCDRSKPATAADAATGDGEAIRLAVGVQVLAKVDQVFVSARDIALERDGVTYASETTSKPDPRCGAPLPARQLKAEESVSGSVLFTLPEREARASTLVFAPTRWGGAPRVAMAMPDCLDACKQPPARRRGAGRQRTL